MGCGQDTHCGQATHCGRADTTTPAVGFVPTVGAEITVGLKPPVGPENHGYAGPYPLWLLYPRICGPLPTVVTIPTVGAVPTAGLRPTGGFLPTAGPQPIVGSKPSRASHIISLYSSVCPTMPGEVAAGGAVIPVGQDQAGGAALQAAGPVGLQVVRAFAIHQPAQVGLPDLGEGVPIEGCREGAAPDLAYQLGILTDVADQLRGAVQGFRAGRVAAH